MNTKLATTFSAEEIAAFGVEMKIALLATINPEGEPHITLISTLKAASAAELVWGQFTEGCSKKHVHARPQTGFLIMTLDKEIWRGTADFERTAQQGVDYDAYNNTPMFRYNSYFGVHTVYYMQLKEQTGREVLSMPRIIFGALKTMLARPLTGRAHGADILNTFTQGMLNKLDSLTFIAYVAEDGYPHIIPVIQLQAHGTRQLIFSGTPYGAELERIPAGSRVAAYCLQLSMENVLLRGTFRGLRGLPGIKTGLVDVDWVYNSMPPVPGQIYPPMELESIRQF